MNRTREEVTSNRREAVNKAKRDIRLALVGSIVGLFFVPMLPIAALQAGRALSVLDKYGSSERRGEARAAQVIGWGVFAIWLICILGLFARN